MLSAMTLAAYYFLVLFGGIHHKHVCLKWVLNGVFHIIPTSDPLLPHEVERRCGLATLQNWLRDHTAPRQLHSILEVSSL